jgi:ATP-dependent 26S proteasome regulatory subunit
VLLTTNEPVDDMHPALLRPGRCLARIEFPAFDASEASKLVGSPVAGPLTLAQIFELRGNINRLHVVAESTAPGQYL